MFHLSDRIMESEAMETFEEVYAYDQLTLKYLTILHNGFIETVINAGPEGGKFLEVGCGTGRISIGVARYVPEARIISADLSDNMLGVAAENARKEGVEDRILFKKADAKALPFDENEFDSVFCHNMLHHIPDPLGVLLEMKRVAKPNGAILIRDLVRVPDVWIPLHVHVLGLPYNQVMKKEYRDSIRAALSSAEWLRLYEAAAIPGAVRTHHFVTHQGIERASEYRRRQRIKVSTPSYLYPFKAMYTSRLSAVDQ